MIDYISWRDLRCGQSINVYGRRLLLVSCDQSTQEWFERNGITQRPLRVSIQHLIVFNRIFPLFLCVFYLYLTISYIRLD